MDALIIAFCAGFAGGLLAALGVTYALRYRMDQLERDLLSARYVDEE